MKKIIFSILFVGCIVAASVSGCSDKKENDEPKVLDEEALAARGKYLVSVMGCNDCHSPKKLGPKGLELEPDLLLSGYPQNRPLPPLDTNVIKGGWYTFNFDMTAAVGPWGVSYAANLTSDETGIGNWSLEQFTKALTQGKWKGMDNGRMLQPPMPWQEFANLTSEDVRAIFTYLKTTKPVKNVEPPVRPLSAL